MRKDLKLHLILGAAIAFIVAALLLSVSRVNIVPAMIGGVGVAAAAGWLKEYWYDAARPEQHTVDAADFKYTVLGGCVGALGLLGVHLAGFIGTLAR